MLGLNFLQKGNLSTHILVFYIFGRVCTHILGSNQVRAHTHAPFTYACARLIRSNNEVITPHNRTCACAHVLIHACFASSSDSTLCETKGADTLYCNVLSAYYSAFGTSIADRAPSGGPKHIKCAGYPQGGAGPSALPPWIPQLHH